MIGDWVQMKENQKIAFQMEDISGTGMFKRWTSDGEYMIPYAYDEIEPIPLTPEILEKNGFSGEGYNMGVIGFHADPIPEVKDGYEVFIWKDMCLEIKHGFTYLKRYTFYVHELQNALKLCGINLEIKL